MRDIVDRLIIYLLCLLCLISVATDVSTLIIGMCAFCYVGLAYYISNQRIKFGFLLAGLVGTFIVKDAGMFLPVIAYEIMGIYEDNKRSIHIWCTLLCFVLIEGWTVAGLPMHISFFVVALSVLSAWLCFQSKRLTQCERRLIRTRDNDEQFRIELESKNRLLIANQDNEIYTATLKERNRIAREIHDNVGHMLSSAILQTGAIKAVNKQENLMPLVETLHTTLDTAMTNIRSSVHDLHDESVDLRASIDDVLASLNGMKVELVYDVEGNVERLTKYCIIGVIKEAVSNIIKHSDGDRVEVLLREHPAFYQLVIWDNGSKKPEKSGGIGLINMRDRVAALHGTIDISTDNGYKIFANIPIEKGEHV